MADLARSVSDDGQVAAPNTTWQRVALDITDRIRSGETPVGSKIASYGQLGERHGASPGTVKRAIEYLRDTGVLKGAQGSGVFVLKVPDDDLDFTSPTVDEVAGRVALIEGTLKEVGSSQAELREMIVLLENRLRDLYDRLGQPYERGNERRATQRRTQQRASDG